MRSRYVIVLVFCTLGCSERRLEFHAVHAADSPIQSEVVQPGQCEDCVSQSWIAHNGKPVALQIERDPFLSVPAHRLSQPVIAHVKGVFRPYCDSFTLSFKLAISLAEMTDIAKNHSELPAVAIVDGRAIDAGRRMLNGETVTLSFAERKDAIDAARMLGASPTYREADDSSRADVLRRQLDETFANPERLNLLASKMGVAVADLNKEEVAAKLFCP